MFLGTPIIQPVVLHMFVSVSGGSCFATKTLEVDLVRKSFKMCRYGESAIRIRHCFLLCTSLRRDTTEQNLSWPERVSPHTNAGNQANHSRRRNILTCRKLSRIHINGRPLSYTQGMRLATRKKSTSREKQRPMEEVAD
jgi:hypothetical protein